MARTNVRMVRTYNALLSYCDGQAIGAELPSEVALAEQFSVSRTVIRNVLEQMDDRGIIARDGRQKLIRRRSRRGDQMEGPPILIDIDELEKRFFDWLLRMDVPRGTVLNVTQMSKEFQVASHLAGIPHLVKPVQYRRAAPQGWLGA